MRYSRYAINIGNCVSTELIDIVKILFGLISREYNNNIVSHAFRSFLIYFVMNVSLFVLIWMNIRYSSLTSSVQIKLASQQIFIDTKFTEKDNASISWTLNIITIESSWLFLFIKWSMAYRASFADVVSSTLSKIGATILLVVTITVLMSD